MGGNGMGVKLWRTRTIAAPTAGRRRMDNNEELRGPECERRVLWVHQSGAVHGGRSGSCADPIGAHGRCTSVAWPVDLIQ